MNTLRWIAVLAVSLCCSFAYADDAAERRRVSAERQRLAAERATVEARHTERAEACGDDFFVTACLDEAQKERREGLDRVRLQQQALDDAERKRRASERLRRIQEKIGARSAAAAAPPRELRPPKQRLPAESVTSTQVEMAGSAVAPKARSPESAAQEASRRAAEQDRLKAAADHKAEVEKRSAERAAKRQRAAPLPVPAASAVSGRSN